jgi:hypothetical protein
MKQPKDKQTCDGGQGVRAQKGATITRVSGGEGKESNRRSWGTGGNSRKCYAIYISYTLSTPTKLRLVLTQKTSYLNPRVRIYLWKTRQVVKGGVGPAIWRCPKSALFCDTKKVVVRADGKGGGESGIRVTKHHSARGVMQY